MHSGGPPSMRVLAASTRTKRTQCAPRRCRPTAVSLQRSAGPCAQGRRARARGACAAPSNQASSCLRAQGSSDENQTAHAWSWGAAPGWRHQQPRRGAAAALAWPRQRVRRRQGRSGKNSFNCGPAASSQIQSEGLSGMCRLAARVRLVRTFGGPQRPRLRAKECGGIARFPCRFFRG